MTNKQKLRMFLVTVWTPWIGVLGWNAGLWLSAELFGGGFDWQLPIRATWMATAIWAVLMLVSWAFGAGYAWLLSPRCQTTTDRK